MDKFSLDTRTGLPEALRVLVQEYPRTGWQTHRNFNGLVQFWMERHMMFRQLVTILTEDVQALSDRRMDHGRYAPRLSRFAGTLLNELHGHHGIEDHHYFPRLVRIDRRAEQGFALLDRDHHAMDGHLHAMAEAANAVLKGGEPGPFAERLDAFARMLNRHLDDEEDIVVPVILASGFQG
ncbi:MAG: hemerythrin domain-containing protein [Rhodobacteraceae bacterium]|nr:MAG: hemerythrin domain-containing protein [Paracoccaceae bacterium]